MDETDRRLLRILQEEGALSAEALAQRVGASATSCWRRVKALEVAGVLGRVVRLVDAAAVGRGVNVMLQLRMKSHAPEDRAAFEAFLKAKPEIMECFSMSGEWDYLMRIAVSSVAEYERFVWRSILNHGNVAQSSSSFALSQVKYTTALHLD